MKHTFRKWFLHAAMVGLCAFAGTAYAQNTEPAAPPAPPAPPAVEAPNVEAPDAAPAPNVEADDPDTDADSSAGAEWRERWRGRRANSDRVSVGNNSTLEKGQYANSVVSVFGSSTSDGDVADAVVSVIGNTRVTGTSKDVVAVLGNVYLDGKAYGDVVATLGNVELGPNAEVYGEVVVVGGELKRDPKAILHRGVQNVMPISFGSFEWLQPWMRKCLLYVRPLAIAPGLGWAWGLALGFLALYVLIAFVARNSVDFCVRTFETQPGKSILAALLATVLTPVLFALLFVTIIGIAFLPFAALALLLAGWFGKAVMLAWIGRCVLRVTDHGAQLHTAIAVLLGGVIVLVLYLVPFVGFIVYKTLGVLGLGVVVYSLMLSARAKRGEAAPPPATAGGPTLAEAPMAFGGESKPFATASDSGQAAFTAEGFDERRPMGSTNEWDSKSDSEAARMQATGTSGFADAPSGTAGASGYTSSSTSSSSGGFGDTSGSATPPPPPPPPSGGGSGSGGPTNPALDPATASTYPRAGFGVRMGALFIDIVLISVLLGIVDSSHEAQLIALATYGAVMWKLKATTIGGIVFGLQVVRVDGRPIDWATATVRALSCFLSLFIAGLGFIWIAFDEGRQAWHDKIAGTAVVRVPKGVSLL